MAVGTADYASRMFLFPLAAAGVSLAFAALLGKQFLARRRPYQAIWAVALLMYAAASFALLMGLQGGWSTGEYRTYWLFGAVLNVPFLALGELYLLVRNRTLNNVFLILLLFATAFAASRVRTGHIDVSALSKDLPLGKDAFVSDRLPYRLSQIFDYPAYLFLLGGSAWSAWKMRGRPELHDRYLGTLGIAIGATIVAIGSGVGAGLNVVPVFSIGLAAGIAVMFWGFVRASRPSALPSKSAS